MNKRNKYKICTMMFSKEFSPKYFNNNIHKYTIGKLLPQSPQILSKTSTQEIFTSGEFGEQELPLKNTKLMLEGSIHNMEFSQCPIFPQFNNSLRQQIEPSTASFLDCMKDISLVINIFHNTLMDIQETLKISPDMPTTPKSCKPMHLKWPLSVLDSTNLSIWEVFIGNLMMFGL